ncbi:hypothetical protein EV426DRAFT_543859 [Tirmania nivea]|nr:hypothetical protein EV426DRAFT_543859 [Tirmania nivea]
MKFSLKLIFALLDVASVALALPPKVTYDGVKVYRIDVGSSPEAVAIIKNLVSKLGLALWTVEIVKNSHVDLEVPKYLVNAFKEATKGYVVSVMHEDLGQSIYKESASTGAQSGSGDSTVGSTFFNAYHPYAEHLQLMDDLVAQFPDHAEIVVAGNSEQGRPITGIHIWGSAEKGSRPAVIFHGTSHAREWISTMTTQYFSWYLLSNYGSGLTKDYVDKYDFYIFPVVNPDGFVYTQTTQRLWRKTRSTIEGSTCVGVDLNRNWSWKWELPDGASTDPCNETFKGRSAGDSAEFKILSAYNDKLANSPAGAKLFIDWHSYSQFFMSPYSYTCTEKAPDDAELVALANGFAVEVKKPYGTIYKSGSICNTIYKATGVSVDYSYDVSKIKYSFAAELRDTGAYGFILPPDQILPTALESWEGVRYILDNIK